VPVPVPAVPVSVSPVSSGSSGPAAPEPVPGLAPAAWWALDVSADGVAAFAADWTIVYINPAGAAVLDRSVAELVGAPMWQTFPEAVGTPFHANLLRAAAAPPGTEPVRWSAFHRPVQNWFSDRAQRVGDYVVVVCTRAGDPREAEVSRQRLTGQVQAALSRSEVLLTASAQFGAAATVDELVGTLQRLIHTGLSPSSVGVYLRDPDGPFLLRQRPQEITARLRPRYERIDLSADMPATVTWSATGRPLRPRWRSCARWATTCCATEPSRLPCSPSWTRPPSAARPPAPPPCWSPCWARTDC